jgi:acetyltransferase-like isoleucine patch superfamily enzyme
MFSLLIKIYTAIYRHKFYSFGKGSEIHPILNVNNPERVSIGEDVIIGSFCWIGANDLPDGPSPQLIIEDGCSIGANSLIHGKKMVHIKKNVLMGPRVFISDSIHQYDDIGLPVTRQPNSIGIPTVIEEDSFLGIGTCVLRGTRIGKHSIIAANSVVVKDIPPFSVAAGNPAKIIKYYDHNQKKWVKYEDNLR